MNSFDLRAMRGLTRLEGLAMQRTISGVTFLGLKPRTEVAERSAGESFPRKVGEV